MENGRTWYIFVILYEEDNFWDFLFPFLHTKSSRKGLYTNIPSKFVSLEDN